MGEVQAGELGEQDDGAEIVGQRRFDLVVEGADVPGSAFEGDFRDELARRIVCADAFESGRALARLGVAAILGLGAEAQVAAAVVQTIAIDVVDDESLRPRPPMPGTPAYIGPFRCCPARTECVC